MLLNRTQNPIVLVPLLVIINAKVRNCQKHGTIYSEPVMNYLSCGHWHVDYLKSEVRAIAMELDNKFIPFEKQEAIIIERLGEENC